MHEKKLPESKLSAPIVFDAWARFLWVFIGVFVREHSTTPLVRERGSFHSGVRLLSIRNSQNGRVTASWFGCSCLRASVTGSPREALASQRVGSGCPSRFSSVGAMAAAFGGTTLLGGQRGTGGESAGSTNFTTWGR